ncbi:MAG TPA: fumarylacetoacetate hydrolase family protein [Actinomycetota bacterium]
MAETVVDLPEAVGHPAFPSTMEALVQRSGGSILDAARDILDDHALVEECAVKRPRLLVPYVSASAPLSIATGKNGAHPDDEPRVSAGLACIVRGNRRALVRKNGLFQPFGYTLAVQWSNPYRGETTTWLGPAVVTAEDAEGTECRLQVSIDGELRYDEPITDLHAAFVATIPSTEERRPIAPGDVVTWMRWSLAPDASPNGRIPTVVEVSSAPIGVLRAQTPAWMRFGS